MKLKDINLRRLSYSFFTLGMKDNFYEKNNGDNS